MRKIFYIFFLSNMLLSSSLWSLSSNLLSNSDIKLPNLTQEISVILTENLTSILPGVKTKNLCSTQSSISAKINLLPVFGSGNFQKFVRNFTYKLHNDLTFNIPPICFKFPRSEHTEEGWKFCLNNKAFLFWQISIKP